MRSYGALFLFYSATVTAAERPWWEADIEAELAILATQNARIEAQIEAEFAQFSAQDVRQLEQEAAAYLRAAELQFTEQDEQRIRNEIERLNAAVRPYFDGEGYLLDPTARFTDRNSR